jgi:hypothetical protein
MGSETRTGVPRTLNHVRKLNFRRFRVHLSMIAGWICFTLTLTARSCPDTAFDLSGDTRALSIALNVFVADWPLVRMAHTL